MNAIDLIGVSKTFKVSGKDKEALKTLSLEVKEGEVFGFIGPNGAGKSTAIKLLLNFLRPDSGRLLIMGRRVGLDEFRDRLGYLPETPCLYNHLTGRETLFFAGRFAGVPPSRLNEETDRLLELVDLTDAAGKPVSGYSKGMKQRLGLAAALAHDPAVLICDEPMSGLDPVGRHLLKKIIMSLRSEGRTIFFSSHILGDVEELCDRIGVIHKGHLLFMGRASDFREGLGLEEAFINAVNGWEDARA